MDSTVILSPIQDLQIILTQVASAFRDDSDLMKKYHMLAPCSYEDGVRQTQEDIEAQHAMAGSKMKMYQIIHSGMVIGFTIVLWHDKDDMELYSFGINAAYRKKFIVLSWLEEVKKLSKNGMHVILWRKNKRAICFLERNSFEEERVEVPEMEEKVLLII